MVRVLGYKKPAGHKQADHKTLYAWRRRKEEQQHMAISSYQRLRAIPRRNQHQAHLLDAGYKKNEVSRPINSAISEKQAHWA
jgi:hypothetical protein